MITITDLFAGAGGSSTGAIANDGVSIRIAANHWRRAVDVHNANHPDADHLCADIAQTDPRYFPHTDILWASPECTNHSIAKGKKRSFGPDLFDETLPDEAAERSRATMWDVPRFTEAHEYRAIIVENVVDAYQWIPFRAWLLAMDAYGYDHQIVCLNSMHAQHGGLPAPQSRTGCTSSSGARATASPTCRGCSARAPGARAAARLSPRCRCGKTLPRHTAATGPSTSTAARRRPCRGQRVEPGWLPAAAAIDWSILGARIGDRAKPLAEKTRTRIAAGIARYWRPFITEHRHEYRTRAIENPLQTLAASGNHFRDWPSLSRSSPSCEEAGQPPALWADPMATVTASGNHHALIAPYYGTAETARPDSEALGTLTTRDRYALVMRNNEGGAEMSTPAREPFRTLTTMGHQSVIEPGDLAAAGAQVDDCLFRMLEPHEVAAGMAFPDNYLWDGTRRERVKMAGNAVTPPTARDLVGAVVEALS